MVQMLEVPACLAAYTDFCTKEHSEEHPMFFSAVERFRLSPAHTKALALSIHTTFLQPHSQYALPLSAEVSAAVLAEIERERTVDTANANATAATTAATATTEKGANEEKKEEEEEERKTESEERKTEEEERKTESDELPPTLFDEVRGMVLTFMIGDSFPRFLHSERYQRFLRSQRHLSCCSIA